VALNLWRNHFSHDSPGVCGGALPAVPNVIAQTNEGYIWLGTESGLYRFDGRQFEEVALPSGPPLKVVLLLADRDGSLWVGAYARLLHLSGGVLQEVSRGVKFLQMIQTSSGEIWAATALTKSPACRVQEKKLECWQGSDMPYSEVIAQDVSGGLWVSDRNGLEHRANGKVVPQSDAERLLTIHINILSRDPRGDLWAAHHAPGEAPNLLRYDGQSWRRAMTLPGIDKSTTIESILVDREMAVWVGTSNRGLYRIIGSQVDHFEHSDGLTGDDVNNIVQDAEGSIWIATSSGLDQFHRSLVDTWTIREGLTTNGLGLLADS
jgi:ligand-binding sensor domain-containing protein